MTETYQEFLDRIAKEGLRWPAWRRALFGGDRTTANEGTMTQWTEQPDGTWRRGPLVVLWDMICAVWFWHCGPGVTPVGGYDTREDAQQVADAWAREMLSKLKELEE